MGTELPTKVMLGQTLVLIQMTFLNNVRKKVGKLVLSRTNCFYIVRFTCNQVLKKTGSIPNSFYFFNYRIYHGHGGHQISFISKSLHLSIYFLPLFTFKKTTGAQLVSQRVMTETKLLLLRRVQKQRVQILVECVLDDIVVFTVCSFKIINSYRPNYEF
jgi:hypothetical protein